MPVVIKARKNDKTRDLVNKFKKATAKAGIVDEARDRKEFLKPALQRNIKKNEWKRQKRVKQLQKQRARSGKKS